MNLISDALTIGKNDITDCVDGIRLDFECRHLLHQLRESLLIDNRGPWKNCIGEEECHEREQYGSEDQRTIDI